MLPGELVTPFHSLSRAVIPPSPRRRCSCPPAPTSCASTGRRDLCAGRAESGASRLVKAERGGSRALARSLSWPRPPARHNDAPGRPPQPGHFRHQEGHRGVHLVSECALALLACGIPVDVVCWVQHQLQICCCRCLLLPCLGCARSRVQERSGDWFEIVGVWRGLQWIFRCSQRVCVLRCRIGGSGLDIRSKARVSAPLYSLACSHEFYCGWGGVGGTARVRPAKQLVLAGYPPFSGQVPGALHCQAAQGRLRGVLAPAVCLPSEVFVFRPALESPGESWRPEPLPSRRSPWAGVERGRKGLQKQRALFLLLEMDTFTTSYSCKAAADNCVLLAVRCGADSGGPHHLPLAAAQVELRRIQHRPSAWRGLGSHSLVSFPASSTLSRRSTAVRPSVLLLTPCCFCRCLFV